MGQFWGLWAWVSASSMPVSIRGRRVMFLQSQPGDGPKPPKRPPCEYCGKQGHPFAARWGSHIGNSMWLSEAILEGREPETHDWYTGRWSIAAHHRGRQQHPGQAAAPLPA